MTEKLSAGCDVGASPRPIDRITIDKVDQSKPLTEWKPLLADFGRRRHLSYTMDFDTRAFSLKDPDDGGPKLPVSSKLKIGSARKLALLGSSG